MRNNPFTKTLTVCCVLPQRTSSCVGWRPPNKNLKIDENPKIRNQHEPIPLYRQIRNHFQDDSHFQDVYIRMIPLYPDGIPYVPHIPMIFVVGSVWWRKFFAPCNTQQKLVTPLDSVGEVYWYGSKLQTNWDHRFGQNVLR